MGANPWARRRPLAAVLILVCAWLIAASWGGAAARGAIPLQKDFAEAVKLARKSGKPILAFWHNGPKSKRKFDYRHDWDDQLQRTLEETLREPGVIGRARQFVWVRIDFAKDREAVKALGIADHLALVDYLKHPPARQGFVFANAEGTIYARLPGRPNHGVLGRMMGAVLKAHSPPGSALRRAPYKTTITYRPYRNPYGSHNRPKQHEYPPHTKTWRECPKCKRALVKAMTFLKKKVNAGASGWLGNFFAGFAFMMAGGCEKELHLCIAHARHHLQGKTGGYCNWQISKCMLLIAEYSLRHGLTRQNRKALERGHQYAVEQIDASGGWFHHPKHGGHNYAHDISMIGTLYFAAFLEMDALGLDVEPGLTLARGYVESISDGYSIGYGTPFKHGRWGSVGKNGLVLMGFHASGNQNDPFARTLGDFLIDNVDAPPKGHGTSWHHFFGAAAGAHRMGPRQYAKYAGYWLHPLIDCQKPDGSIAPLPHDNHAARSGAPPEKVLEGVKNSDKHDYAATGVLACLIFMTEPGAFSVHKKAETPGRPEKKRKRRLPFPLH